MARVLRVRPGQAVQVGEAMVTVRVRQRGGLELVIEAPREIPIVPPPRRAASGLDPDQLALPIDLPELPPAAAHPDDIPY